LNELRRVLALGATVVGINNRNLRDFSVDIDTTRALRPHVPEGIVVVSESGIRGPEDVVALRHIGVDAALVGEALVTAADPAAMLRAMVEAGR
jgi:indole-3-glycerol phosphate synthase